MGCLDQVLLFLTFNRLFLGVVANLLVLSFQSCDFLPQLLDLELVLFVRLIHLISKSLSWARLLFSMLFLLFFIDLSQCDFNVLVRGATRGFRLF